MIFFLNLEISFADLVEVPLRVFLVGIIILQKELEVISE